MFSGSSKALVFVVDTTESMSDDLPAVKAATETLVTTQEGTPDEPSVYILVPFGDPGRKPPELGMLCLLSCLVSALVSLFLL